MRRQAVSASNGSANQSLEPRPVTIGHVGLTVRNLDRAVAFYADVVGLRLTERFTYPEAVVGHGLTVVAGAFMRCDSSHHCLSIFALRPELQRPEDTASPGQGLHHIAFEMATPDELLAKLRHVRAQGVPIANERRGGPGNQPRFYIRDPEENLIEFYWGIDQIGWQGNPRAYGPIQEIDLENYDFADFVRERDGAAIAQVGSDRGLD